ncbi:MAG: hypothetical protein K9M80_09010, partial [Candidatus Marinimicrobia bacterium]|nr:hypothetical protein [Candidatus Neomarinimicrobiota bacterium]
MKAKNINIIILFCILSCILSLNAQEEYDGYIVKDIEFSGNEKFSRKELLKQIPIRETIFLRRHIFRKKAFRYSEELLTASLEILQKFYQREGYLNTSVEKDKLVANQKKGQIDLISISINEGRPIRVGKINYNIAPESDIDSNKKDQIIDKITDSRILTEGLRFRDQDFKLDKEAIIGIFNSEGYTFAKAEHNLQLIVSQQIVNINWQIKPGQKYYFGETNVVGNQHISNNFILKQLAYDKGELFRRTQIVKTQNNIYDLGLFQLVNVRAKYDNQGDNRIPVEISVKEAPRLNTQIGFGYGSEDKFRTFIDLRRLNLFGGARRAEFSARHSALELYNINLKYVQPQFITRKATIIINPYIRRETEPGYETRRGGVNLPFSYKFTKDLKSSVNFYMERVLQEVNKNIPVMNRV